MNRAWNTAIKQPRVYMSSARLGNLSELVRSQYQKAIEAGDAFFYDSQVRVTKSGASQDGERQKTVPWQIRTVPALLKKPKAEPSSTASDEKKEIHHQPMQNQRDVFAPPYVPNLLVKELDNFTVLLNKYCVLPGHFLLVTRDFVKQEKPPSPEMLSLVYNIIMSHTPTRPDAELLGFFNCGPNSGASQPHCHFQLVELTPTEPDSKAVPIETMLETDMSPDENKGT